MKKILGYVIGETYHSAYWHYDFKVLGFTKGGAVTVKQLSDSDGSRKKGEVWSHMTAADRHTIRPGQCRVCR